MSSWGPSKPFLLSTYSIQIHLTWPAVTFTVGSNINGFPMAIFKVSLLFAKSPTLNDLHAIDNWRGYGPLYSELESTRREDPADWNHTGLCRYSIFAWPAKDGAEALLHIGGRPQVTVNGWSGPQPPAPSQPDSRGVTRGTVSIPLAFLGLFGLILTTLYVSGEET